MRPGELRVVVLGAGGQLGGELVAALAAAGHQARGLSSAVCDVTDADAVEAAMAVWRPDAVVNCAAYTAVDAAEDDPDAAYRVNALGARHVAAACHRAGVLLCHLSTDYVFDGTATSPIDEWTPVTPLSVYGRSKAAGEAEVRALCPRHQVVRTSWLYGRDGPNFVLSILRRAREEGRLRVVADQRGCPTWTGHLAAALVRLLERGVSGTFHLCNGGDTTWHGLAQAVLAEVGWDVAVEPIATVDYPAAAPRPRYSVLDCRAWRLLGEPPLPPWQEGVRAYVAELRARGHPVLSDPPRGRAAELPGTGPVAPPSSSSRAPRSTTSIAPRSS